MKKIWFSILAIAMCMMVFSSCSKSLKDPLVMARFYDDADYSVLVVIDDEGIGEIADELDIRSKGIDCVVVVAPEDDTEGEKIGMFIYCTTNEIAEKMADDLEEYAKSNDDFKDDIVRGMVERDKKLVFIGCEDTWEEVQEQ